MSAACFVRCRLVPEKDGYRLEHEPRVNFYEFHDVPGNPELLAILKIANDVLRGRKQASSQSIAFVSDCALGQQEAVSERQSPVYGTHLLPSGFQIFYASSDTGWEFLNKLIAFCDKQSRFYLEEYQKNSLPATERIVLEEDPSVTYRFMSRAGLEVVNPHITGAALPPAPRAEPAGAYQVPVPLPLLVPGDHEYSLLWASDAGFRNQFCKDNLP